MRADTIIENNKSLVKKHNGLKTEKDIGLAILDVMTDISETMAAELDFMSFIFNRSVIFPGDDPQMQNGGKKNG